MIVLRFTIDAERTTMLLASLTHSLGRVERTAPWPPAAARLCIGCYYHRSLAS